MKRFMSLLLCGFLTGCSGSVQQYAGTQPQFDFVEYFTGEVDAWGVQYDWKGDVSKRFHILMTGTREDMNGDKKLRLDEIFTYSDGHIWKRYWQITQHADGRLTGFAPEVDGKTFKADNAGFAQHFTYDFVAPLDGGKSVTLYLDDWLYMLDEHTVVNRNIMKKFGLKVGELQIFFRKKGS